MPSTGQSLDTAVATGPRAADNTPATPPANSAESTSLFVDEWQTYRKMVDNNYLFHREAYATLQRVLLTEMRRPFRFLDIACGDASATVAALRGTTIGAYHGVDISAAALELAGRTLGGLACPVKLEQRDFPDALAEPGLAADVVWIGLSLHHYKAPGKLALMRQIRRVVGDDGIFLIYEDTSRDGEDRASWLRRWDAQEAGWTAYTPAEWKSVADHVHAADFPEMAADWHTLGRDAGFGRVRELFRSPTELFGLYAFQA